MRTLLAILLLLCSTANADVIRIPDFEQPRRCFEHRECRPVTIRRTTIYVDQYGRELWREVSYRRAWLCEDAPYLPIRHPLGLGSPSEQR